MINKEEKNNSRPPLEILEIMIKSRQSELKLRSNIMSRFTPGTEPTWSTLDKTSFAGDAKKALASFDESNAETKLRREVLDDILAKKLAGRCPDGMTPRISHKWGNISWIPVDPKKTASKGKGKYEAL